MVEKAQWLYRTMLLGLCAGAVGCRADSDVPLSRVTDSEDDPGVVIRDAGSGDVVDPVAPEASPHALLAVEPPHGPFSGGTRVLLRGNGFGSDARVWFGDAEIDPSLVLPVGPQRIQVTSPPGLAGLADVVVQNGADASTQVTLIGGFSYDPFRIEPPSGPTSGGTRITLIGQGTDWDEDTEVSIDREPCEMVEVKSPTELTCEVPSGSAGSKSVRVETADGPVDVLDAFTYSNSDNGFRGGLSGSSLADEIKLLILNDRTGNAVPNALVVVGEDDDEAIVERTNRDGIAVLSRDGLGPRQTVTVAAHCMQPITFVDVPVDTVTVYLDAVLSPACADPSGDIPSGGGTPGTASGVSGELVWPEAQEFRRTGWTNVPAPTTELEQKVAYVFNLSQDPTQSFRLPSGVLGVTPVSSGETGYSFYMTTPPGNFTLYALAGIENRERTPYRFTAYAMGLLRGVAVPQGTTVGDVFIQVDVPLDHKITMKLDGPQPTSKGPDRLQASVAIRVGSEGFVLLPNGRTDLLLGSEVTFDLVGVPPLVGTLAGTSYVATARAVTGEAAAMPRSLVGAVSSTSTHAPLQPGPFLEIPVLEDPEPNGTWNGRDLAWSSAPGGPEPDLWVMDVQTPTGLQTWRIVSEGRVGHVKLPDLGALDPDLSWPTGLQTVQIASAKLEGFEYGSLVYKDLTSKGWTANAVDSFFVAY